MYHYYKNIIEIESVIMEDRKRFLAEQGLLQSLIREEIKCGSQTP